MTGSGRNGSQPLRSPRFWGRPRPFWSTALARGGGSFKKLAERQGPCWRALVRARTRLSSVYPLGDCSRSQFFVNEGVASGEVDEGESECLASSCRGWAHGALLVPIAARRWAPNLLIEEETPSEGQRMVSGNRSSCSLGIYLGESLERKC